MRLGDVITTLEALPADKVLAPGFGHADSYRGYYNEIAFVPLDEARVADMLAEAKRAVGATYEGYKGGDFLMDEDTTCNVAEYGMCGATDDALTPEFFGGERDMDAEAQTEAGRLGKAALNVAQVVGNPHPDKVVEMAFMTGYEWAKERLGK